MRGARLFLTSIAGVICPGAMSATSVPRRLRACCCAPTSAISVVCCSVVLSTRLASWPVSPAMRRPLLRPSMLSRSFRIAYSFDASRLDLVELERLHVVRVDADAQAVLVQILRRARRGPQRLVRIAGEQVPHLELGFSVRLLVQAIDPLRAVAVEAVRRLLPNAVVQVAEHQH